MYSNVRMNARNIVYHHMGAKFQSSWNCVNYNSTGHSYHKLKLKYALHKGTCHYYCKPRGNIWKFSDASNDRKNVVLSLTTPGDVLATCNFCTQQVRRLIYGYLRAFTDLYISLAVLCFQTWTSVEQNANRAKSTGVYVHFAHIANLIISVCTGYPKTRVPACQITTRVLFPLPGSKNVAH